MMRFLGLDIALMLVIISTPAAGLLCAAACMAICGRPHQREFLNRGAWLIGSGALTVSAVGIGAWIAALQSPGPARLPLVGIQTEEILWPALPMALACLAIAAITRRWPRAQPGPPRLGRGRRWGLDAAAALVTLATLYWVVSAWPLLPVAVGGWGNKPFDSYEWQSASTDFDSPRGAMVRSLLRGWRPCGKTRTEVLTALGEPDLQGGPVFEYFVGAHSGFGIDDDSLALYFDSQGRVGGWRVYPH